MRVRVLAFARLRELIGSGAIEADLADGATVGDLWAQLAREHHDLAGLDRSTSVRRGARALAPGDALVDGDEIALLPPFGGG